MKHVIINIIHATENGVNMDDELHIVYKYICAMGIDVDDEYLLKCTDVEQAKYYLTLLK